MIDLKTFGSEFWYSSNKFRDLFKKTSEFALSFNGYEYWGEYKNDIKQGQGLKQEEGKLYKVTYEEDELQYYSYYEE